MSELFLEDEELHRVETEAVNRRWQGVRLDTFEFQAREFYESLGFNFFGEIRNYLAGFARYLFRSLFESHARG